MTQGLSLLSPPRTLRKGQSWKDSLSSFSKVTQPSHGSSQNSHWDQRFLNLADWGRACLMGWPANVAKTDLQWTWICLPPLSIRLQNLPTWPLGPQVTHGHVGPRGTRDALDRKTLPNAFSRTSWAHMSLSNSQTRETTWVNPRAWQRRKVAPHPMQACPDHSGGLPS